MKGLRKAGVRTLEAANQYLEQHYLPLWNERFTVTPAGDVDAHRPLGKQHRLASSLSHVETRVVGHDYTLRYDRHLYQVAREHIQPRLRGQSVRVEQHRDGRLLVSATEANSQCACVSKPSRLPGHRSFGPSRRRHHPPAADGVGCMAFG